MKFIDKVLRYPLPDQLKAVVEKFDTDFDASHLRTLDSLSESRGFTRYERYILRRTYNNAKRVTALNEAMELVLNLRKPPRVEIRPKSATLQNLYRNTIF